MGFWQFINEEIVDIWSLYCDRTLKFIKTKGSLPTDSEETGHQKPYIYQALVGFCIFRWIDLLYSGLQYSALPLQWPTVQCSAEQFSVVQCFQYSIVHYPIFKSDKHRLNGRVPLNLPRVVCNTYSLFLWADAQECVFHNTCNRDCTSQYHP